MRRWIGSVFALGWLTAMSSQVRAAEPLWPVPDWSSAKPESLHLDSAKLAAARDYALTGGGAGMIVVGGQVVLAWGDLSQTFDLKSSAKSIGVTALGLAIKDGKLKLTDKARQHHPGLGLPPESNRETGWLNEITIQHLATQTAGFEKPGGYGKLLFAPGTKWHYTDAGPNWLAECITLAYNRDVNDLLFERVFTPLGIKDTDLKWRKNAYRDAQINNIERREFGAGIQANVNALSRIGYLYLRNGQWQDQAILEKSFVDLVGTTVKDVSGLPVLEPENYGKASDHYGLLWWNNADGTLVGVPKDAYWAWGLYDSLIVVIPSLDLVAVRAGKSWPRKSQEHYAVLAPFMEPIVAAFKPVRDKNVGPERK